MAEFIQCTKCYEWKDPKLFGDRVEKDNGKRSECYSCAEKQSKEWRQRNEAKVRDNKRLQYLRKRDMQTRQVGDNCEICGLEFDKTTQVGSKAANSPHWDHNHTTGQFRGWLCHNCNALLGHAKDKESLLLRAVEYLRR